MKQEDADEFAHRLAKATQRVVADYQEGDVVGEEPFSDQLCGRLKETLEDFETPNVRWQVDVAVGGEGAARLRMRTLNKRTEEPRFGADLVMVLDLKLKDYTIRKGLLAQAKRLEPGKNMKTADWMKLRDQCADMLEITPASMVFLYSKSGITPISATAAVAYGQRDLHELETYSMEVFFRDFAICWIGDPHIQASDPASLEALRLVTGARAAVRFVGVDRDAETGD